jgi:two-component system phosphate regulon response regulator PhoB
MPERILVVDDEPDLQDLVELTLCEAGYEVETAACGRDAIAKVRQTPPDLLVLDLMLPDMPGTEVCRHLRGRTATEDLPILMLTAKSEEVDRVVGFELGADDYVTKPFSPRELALRVRALLRRRAAPPDDENLLEHRGIQLDLERHRCSAQGEDVRLTAKEFRLLVALMRRPGHVLTRERLLQTAWGSEITVTLRTIDTHLKRLREKLGPVGDTIETVRGVGYRIAE